MPGDGPDLRDHLGMVRSLARPAYLRIRPRPEWDDVVAEVYVFLAAHVARRFEPHRGTLYKFCRMRMLGFQSHWLRRHHGMVTMMVGRHPSGAPRMVWRPGLIRGLELDDEMAPQQADDDGRDELDAFWRRLTPREREYLQARAWTGRHVGAIASGIGVSVGRAKELWKQIRKKAEAIP